MTTHKEKCDKCGDLMDSGFCIYDGEEHYCSLECLHSVYTSEEYEEMYKNDEAYYTEYEEPAYGYMDKIAEIFGLELGDKFILNNYTELVYRLTEDGVEYKDKDHQKWIIATDNILQGVLTSSKKRPYKKTSFYSKNRTNILNI